MSIFRRIGTQKHKYKVQFFIKKVTFNKNMNGKVYISIRRGDHKVNSEQQVEFEEKVCNFKNESLALPAVTLFYQQSQQKYQQKLGEIKVVMKTSKDEKKLLGVVPFDLATYANEKGTKTFKQKKQLEQTPQSLKGIISFQIFIDYIGDGTQTSKSIAKQEKPIARDESPLNKFASFFGFGGADESQHKKNEGSPPEDEGEDPKKQEKVKKKKRVKEEQLQEVEQLDKQKGRNQQKKPTGTSRRKRQQERSRPKDLQEREKEKEKEIKKNQQKDEKKKEKTKTKSDQEAKIFNQNYPPQNGSRSIKKQKKPKKKEPSPQGSDGQDDRQQRQQNIFHKQTSQKKEKRRQQSKDQLKDTKEGKKRPPKQAQNYITPNYHDSLTQMSEPERKNGSNAKSETSKPVEQKKQFYFDDPTTFPQAYKQKNKPTKQTTASESVNKQKKAQRKHKQKQKQQPQNFNERLGRVEDKSDRKEEMKQATKKVKQNTISIGQKKNKEAKIDEERNQVSMFGVQATHGHDKEDTKEVQGKGSSKGSEKHKRNLIVESPAKPKKEEKALFSQFEAQPSQKVIPAPILKQYGQKDKLKAKQKGAQKSMELQYLKELDKLKKQLEERKIQIEQLKVQVQQMQQLKAKLKQLEQKLKSTESLNSELKIQSARREKELTKLKSENQSLKGQVTKNQSFFRETEMRYQDSNNEGDIQQEIKRLQKQKNEYMLNLQKEKEKGKKQVKQFNQEIQKQKLKFKQYEDLSKAQLTKLKDEMLKKNGTIESLNEKLKVKKNQHETLLKENKLMNQNNIELKEKLASLKIKIGEKLNEANENGQAQIMEVLTDLNKQI